MRIETAAGVISFTEKGTGHPLVLLHSLLADAGSFDLVIDGLAQHFRVIVLDLPGFGGSAPITGDLNAFAEWLAAAVEAIAPGRRPAIIGNGFGAFVALQAAISHPALMSRLVLASCGAAFSPAGQAAFRGMAKAASAKGLESISDTAMRRLFAPAFQAANPALMAARRGAFLRTDEAVFQAACDALASLDIRRDVAGVRIPVLVVAGDQDEATPPEMGRELAGLVPNARLVMLPGCAHVPQLQMPDAFLSAILTFVTATA